MGLHDNADDIQSTSEKDAVKAKVMVRNTGYIDNMIPVLNKVAMECNAFSFDRLKASKDINILNLNFSDILSSSRSSTSDKTEMTSTLVFDLSKIVENIQSVSTEFESCTQFRFRVRSCFDVHVLKILAFCHSNIVFEVCDMSQVHVLSKLVPRERLVFTCCVLTTQILKQVSSYVDTFELRTMPDDHVLDLLKAKHASIEVSMTNVMKEKWGELVHGLKCRGLKVKVIGIEEENFLSMKERKEFGCDIKVKPWQVSGDGHDNVNLNGYIIDMSESIFKNALHLILTVIGQRIRNNHNVTNTFRQDVFVNDGIYGCLASVCGMRAQLNFSDAQRNNRITLNNLRSDVTNETTLNTIVWGPTCDATDRIWNGDMQVVGVGDHLHVPNVGPYLMDLRSSFNGFGADLAKAYVVFE